MPPTGPDDRAEQTRRGTPDDAAASGAASPTPDRARDGEFSPPRDVGGRGLPPGVRDEALPEGMDPTGERSNLSAAETVGEHADPDAAPVVHRDTPARDPSRGTGNQLPQPWDSEAYPPDSGQSARPEMPDRSYAEPTRQYDRFGWPVPAETDESRRDQRPESPVQEGGDRRGSSPRDVRPPTPEYPVRDNSSWRLPPTPGAPPRGSYSGQFPTQGPAPNQPPRGPYSGQFPVQPPSQQSGAFPVARNDERPYRQSAAFPIPPPQGDRSGPIPIPPDMTGSGPLPVPPATGNPDDRRSGQFALPPPDSVSQSGAYPIPPESGTSGYAVTASGPIPQSPYISGPLPRVSEQADAVRRSGSLVSPGDVTSTGSRRVIVAPDAGAGLLLADRPALGFLLAALALAGAMVVYIVVRYAHFPSQIALHFGPAGSSQPTRIGEKRELWTIPFIVGIVLAANTALAWAVYHYDRFAARLLTFGSALIAAIAWIVLLTVLHR